MPRTWGRAWLATLLATSLPGVMLPQGSPLAFEQRRWGIAVYLGASSGGPARDLESSMTANGYTDPFGGCGFFGCVPESPSPSSYSHANPWLLSIRYRARGAFGAELLLGQSSSGETSGRRGDEMLRVEYGGTLVAPLAFAGTPRFRVGLGPALLRGRWTYRDPSDGSAERETTRTLGWIGSAAVGIPVGWGLELGAIGQYRGFGGATVGQSSAGTPTLSSATVRSPHWYAGGGVGLRF